jgi:hypothetical protein
MSSKHYPETTPDSNRSPTTHTHHAAPPVTLQGLVVCVALATALPLTLAYPGVVVSLAVVAVGALLVRERRGD